MMDYKRFLVIVAFVFASSFRVFGQDAELARQLVEIGDEILRSTIAYDQARSQYLAALEADPSNIKANYMAGEMYLLSVEKDKALEYFQKTLEMDPEYSFDLLYKIGLSFHYGYEFDRAIEFYNMYLTQLEAQPNYSGDKLIPQEYVIRKIEECNIGMELVQTPREVTIQNLGEVINSEYDEYAPVINAEEDLIIFTSRRFDGNLSVDVHEDNLPFEDIYFSTRTGEEWSFAQNIGEPVNTESHNSNLALSFDGTELYLYNDANNGDIFLSTRQPDGTWSEPERLPEPINSEYGENGVAVSDDGQFLVFSSDREGGEGGSDIYISERSNSGRWRNPRNISSTINTEYDEVGPFLGHDGKSLYFSSLGGRGMGGFDIYKSEYDSASGDWGEPQNIGYPINTPDDDVHFTPTQDGYRAFYATTRDDGLGNFDLYEITFIDDFERITNAEPEPAPAPEPVLVPVNYTVTVLDATTSQPIASDISLIHPNGSAMVGSKSGDVYQFELNHESGLEFQLSAESNGYIYYNDLVRIPGMSTENISMNKTILLKKAEMGNRKILRNLYFDFDLVTLKESSAPEMEKLEKMLNDNPNITVGIVGHTDNIGTDEYNLDLSKRRAMAVKNYLVSKQIDPARIKTGGLGARFPMASNLDEREGRELNRRVEMVVLTN